MTTPAGLPPHNNNNNNDTNDNIETERSPIQALAFQLRLTREDTESLVNIVKHCDPPLEWLKDPKVLSVINQRKGRWIQEEEDYANFLNHEFCIGLSEIANGTTKRAFLSSKLACTKMRVSKKFKGQNTGKEVFDRKANKFSALEINYYKQRHNELEKKFLRSVLKAEIVGNLKHSQKNVMIPSSQPNMPHQPLSKATKTTLPDKASSRTTSIVTSYAPNVNTNKNTCVEYTSRNGITTLSTSLNGAGNGQLICNDHRSVPSPTDQLTSPLMNVPVTTITTSCDSPPKYWSQLPSNTCQDTTFLSPSFTNQFESMSTKSATNSPAFDCPVQNMNPIFPTKSAVSRQALNSNINAYDLKTPSKCRMGFLDSTQVSKKRRLDVDSLNRSQFRPIPAVAVSQDGTSASGSSSQSDDRVNHTSPNEAYSNSTSIFPHRISMVSEMNVSDNDIPDLLVGFDKHVASMRKIAEAATNGVEHRPIPEDSHFFAGTCCGESPYITSKSFDELHKYLGKGLSSETIPHLDLNDHNQYSGWPVGVYCRQRQKNSIFEFQRSTADANNNMHPCTQVAASSSACHAEHYHNAPSQYLSRPSSTSNCSDLTCSD